MRNYIESRQSHPLTPAIALLGAAAILIAAIHDDPRSGVSATVFLVICALSY
jgi:hypothetical protein